MEHQTLGRQFVCPIGPATQREFILDWRISRRQDSGGKTWVENGVKKLPTKDIPRSFKLHMQPRSKQDQLHFGYQKLCLPRNESASLKTKMFSTRQIVCHLPADFLAVKKEFSWLKNCCSSLSATCKSLWNFEQRENKKSGSATPFYLLVSGDLSRKLCLCCK